MLIFSSKRKRLLKDSNKNFYIFPKKNILQKEKKYFKFIRNKKYVLQNKKPSISIKKTVYFKRYFYLEEKNLLTIAAT